MTTTPERLTALEQQLAHNTAMLAEIHIAVVGNGSSGSSLRERVASLEVANDFRHRAIYSVFPSILIAALAQFGLHLPPPHAS